MPRNSKLDIETETRLRNLVENGHSKLQISQIMGFNKETIRYWCKKLNLNPSNRQESKNDLKKEEFKKLLEEGKTITEARIKVGISPSTAQKWADLLGVRDKVRTRAQAAIEDKVLSFEEATKRMPAGSGKVIGFENKKYIIQTEDGFIYRKSSSKLYQGDPRGKSGTRWDLSMVTAFLKNLGYEYVEGFTKIGKPLKARHEKCGNIRETRLKLFESQECPTCSNRGVSRQEEQVKSWIESLGFTTCKYKFPNNTTKKKEIDIFIPSLKLGIEYCGLHWHTEESGKNRTYHINKMKEANSEGIRLITIFEDEWLERQDQVKNFLLSVMNQNQYKIHGRNTVVKVADKEMANKFYEDNHIQGRPSTTILHIGLYTKDGTMVGCMSFGPHHRGSESKVVVLNRLAFLHNHTVHGGASKLLSFAISLLKPMGYEKILSWSDNRWSEGKVYAALGFFLEDELGPDYSYVKKDGGRISKQCCRKKDLLKRGAIGNTESEMVKSLGYSKIWDCGKKRWVMNI